MTSNTGYSGPPNKKLKQCTLSYFKPQNIDNPDPLSSLPAQSKNSATSTSSSSSSLPAQSTKSATSSSSSESASIPVTTSGKPNQPSICYKADNNGRRFQEGWYKRWQWLDWNY